MRKRMKILFFKTNKFSLATNWRCMRIKLILLGKTKGFGQGYEKITKRLAPLRGCKFEFHKCRIVFQTLGGLLEICSAVNLIRVLKLVEVRISLEKNPFQHISKPRLCLAAQASPDIRLIKRKFCLEHWKPEPVKWYSCGCVVKLIRSIYLIKSHPHHMHVQPWLNYPFDSLQNSNIIFLCFPSSIIILDNEMLHYDVHCFKTVWHYEINTCVGENHGGGRHLGQRDRRRI